MIVLVFDSALDYISVQQQLHREYIDILSDYPMSGNLEGKVDTVVDAEYVVLRDRPAMLNVSGVSTQSRASSHNTSTVSQAIRKAGSPKQEHCSAGLNRSNVFTGGSSCWN
jgi:hypothetical protein